MAVRARYLGAVLALALGALAAARVPARADEHDLSITEAPPAQPPAAQEGQPRRPGRVAWQVTGVTVVGVLWYVANTNLNQEDWELRWDWPSWRLKLLTADGIRFDTNKFEINAVRHPLEGTLDYQIGRANGYGKVGATLINLGATLFWEYIVEFKEMPSLNDVIVTTATGISIGEPLFQISRYARSGPRTTANRVLAFASSPFDGLDPWSASLRPRPWHRFQVDAGAASSRFGASAARREWRLGVNFEVPHNRVALLFRFAPGEADGSLVGARMLARTSYLGRRFGAHAHAGLGAAFTYDIRRLAEEWDNVAIAHVVGPQLELELARRAWRLHVELAAYADFGMVQAHVFGPVMPFDPDPDDPTSALREQGYYYGVGSTVTGRVELEWPRFSLTLEGARHDSWSIDGFDRRELGDGLEDPHDVFDQRLSGSAALGFVPVEGISVLGLVEGTRRHGTWNEEDRRTAETTAGVQLRFTF